MSSVVAGLAKERPEEVALADARGSWTWAQVSAALNRAVSALTALPLGPERRVAVFAENAAETVLAHVAALLSGSSAVPVNFHLGQEEVAFILADSGTEAVFVGPETVAIGVAAAAEAGVATVIGWRCGADDGVTDWEQWLSEASDAPTSTDAIARPTLLYTSGTTGRPKGVELPPTMFGSGSTVGDLVAHLGAHRRAQFRAYLVVGPMYHTGPLSGARMLAAGLPIIVLGRFDAEATLAAIETHRIESTTMVPTHFVRLLALPEEVRARYDVSSLQLVTHTGSACPVEVKRAMIEWWGPVLYEAYGATEVGTVCAITSEEWLEHPGSVGRAVPPFSVLVVDDDGEPVPERTEGRLYFVDATGRGVEYHNNPEMSAAAHLRPGVFTLGEIGFVDDGYVYITDRFSDMVVSGGVNIYPAEAEQALIDHPQVLDVAVLGVPDPEMGEQVKALVIPVDAAHPPTPEELIAFCRSRIAGYKCPRSVDFVETLGRNAMGKINKRSLRDEHLSRPPT